MQRVRAARRFEDLVFWRQARELTKLVNTLTQKNGFAKDYGMKDQIQRREKEIVL